MDPVGSGPRVDGPALVRHQVCRGLGDIESVRVRVKHVRYGCRGRPVAPTWVRPVAAGVVRKKKKHATRCAKAATWTAEISRPTNAGLMLNLHGGEQGGGGCVRAAAAAAAATVMAAIEQSRTCPENL